jgi:hypothetical protein
MRMVSAADDAFDTHEFPSTTTAFAEAHGDVELELPKGSATLGDVLTSLPSADLASEEDARLATYNALSAAAIGRKNYSDRDATAPGEDGHEPQSI